MTFLLGENPGPKCLHFVILDDPSGIGPVGCLRLRGLNRIVIFLNERFPTKMRDRDFTFLECRFCRRRNDANVRDARKSDDRGIPQTVQTFPLAAIVLYVRGAITVPETKGNMA
jgi:hypothetical protein